MLGVSGLIGDESGGASGGSSEVGAGSTSIHVDESDRTGGGGGGNRWPRQETLALLKIRSDMDVTFRDSSLKGPLWDEVSRKMAELGFQRSAKKCREKFENVYKYHKRTKDGRAAKSDGKTYRFFDQLQALDTTPAAAHPPPVTMPPSNTTVSSISPTPLSVVHPNADPISVTNPLSSSPLFQTVPSTQPPQQTVQHTPAVLNNPPPLPHGNFQQPPPPMSFLSDSTSSSTSSDEDIQRRRHRRGKKRKWKDYFERLMAEVVQKQESMQKKFLESLENRERDRIAREESWRVQEIARMNREHDLLLQERSMAAAKDAAVISFLQKVSDQHNLQIPITTTTAAAPPPPPPPPPPSQPSMPLQPSPISPPPPQNYPPAPPPPIAAAPPAITPTKTDNGGGGDNFSGPSSSRWPKPEVQALINLRTSMDTKYQENGPKGPLWEEISAAMAKLGYNRSSKRCKEKWENINKYFKKVKESNKKRTEDSKTCPYFNQLEAIYKERAKNDVVGYAAMTTTTNVNVAPPIMVTPEQQWPGDHRPMHHHDQDAEMDDDDEEDDDDEDEGGAEFHIMVNKEREE